MIDPGKIQGFHKKNKAAFPSPKFWDFDWINGFLDSFFFSISSEEYQIVHYFCRQKRQKNLYHQCGPVHVGPKYVCKHIKSRGSKGEESKKRFQSNFLDTKMVPPNLVITRSKWPSSSGKPTIPWCSGFLVRKRGGPGSNPVRDIQFFHFGGWWYKRVRLNSRILP